MNNTCQLKFSTIHECRQVFLEKDSDFYQTIPPDLLVSDIFPTSFTSSAGPNLASRTLLEHSLLSPWNRVSVIQPCLRYWDIPTVGDGRHLSFFEMATRVVVGGNRWQVLRDIVQLLIDDFAIDINRIWATFYKGGRVADREFPTDVEAIQFWENLGLPQSRIVPVFGSEGFVANRHEAVGGYRTELYVEKSKYCTGNCQTCLPGYSQCQRFIEVATNVTYEFAVNFERIPPIELIGSTPVHAAGFGLERVFQVIHEETDIGSVDSISRLRDAILMYSSLKNRQDKHYLQQATIAADHIRGLTFLAREGVDRLSGRSNRGRRWIINRYAKSLLETINQLEVSSDMIVRYLVPLVVEVHSSYYPELITKLTNIQHGVDNILNRVSAG
jgi:alanyl-tRNA synthetase